MPGASGEQSIYCGNALAQQVLPFLSAFPLFLSSLPFLSSFPLFLLPPPRPFPKPRSLFLFLPPNSTLSSTSSYNVYAVVQWLIVTGKDVRLISAETKTLVGSWSPPGGQVAKLSGLEGGKGAAVANAMSAAG